MELITSEVDVQVDYGQLMAALGIDAKKYDVDSIDRVKLRWSYDLDVSGNGTVVVTPRVPDQTIQVKLDLVSMDDDSSESRSFPFDLKGVRHELMVVDDGPVNLTSFKFLPVSLTLGGKSEVTFEVGS